LAPAGGIFFELKTYSEDVRIVCLPPPIRSVLNLKIAARDVRVSVGEFERLEFQVDSHSPPLVLQNFRQQSARIDQWMS